MALTVRPAFAATQFADTRFDTAADKAEGIELLARFVESGFSSRRWTKKLYHVLYQHLFSHIAHFDQGGFWDEWFADEDSQRAWRSHALMASSFGSPDHTWSDAQVVFQDWLADQYVAA